MPDLSRGDSGRGGGGGSRCMCTRDLSSQSFERSAHFKCIKCLRISPISTRIIAMHQPVIGCSGVDVPPPPPKVWICLTELILLIRRVAQYTNTPLCKNSSISGHTAAVQLLPWSHNGCNKNIHACHCQFAVVQKINTSHGNAHHYFKNTSLPEPLQEVVCDQIRKCY